MVTYNPDDHLEANIRALRSQVAEVIVVDNNSEAPSREMIARIASTSSVTIIWNERNCGVASALNTGICAARDKTFRWVLTIDQDSKVSEGFIASLWAAYWLCPFNEYAAIIGPHYCITGADGREREHLAVPFREAKCIMASGNLLNLDIFFQCGTFNETYFMDYVDHEFCLRARKHGFHVIEAVNVTLLHRLGSTATHQLFGRTFTATHHTPDRRYYNSRNRLWTYRKYWRREPVWVLADLRAFAKEMLKMVVFENNRWEKLKSVGKGLRDGIFKSA